MYVGACRGNTPLKFLETVWASDVRQTIYSFFDAFFESSSTALTKMLSFINVWTWMKWSILVNPLVAVWIPLPRKAQLLLSFRIFCDLPTKYIFWRKWKNYCKLKMIYLLQSLSESRFFIGFWQLCWSEGFIENSGKFFLFFSRIKSYFEAIQAAGGAEGDWQRKREPAHVLTPSPNTWHQ